jgi:serpin B
MIDRNKAKLRKFISLGIILLSITIYNTFLPKVHADSIDSNANSSVLQWGEKKEVSTIKTWKINLRTQVDQNSLYQPGVITVTDSQGNLMDVKICTDNEGKYIYVEPPKIGYKQGQTYYLNISKDLKFGEENESMKNSIQMKFTANDIGTINIDENSSVTAANNAFGFNLMKNLINKDKNKNMVISPLSVSTILAMTQNGADNETKQEMINCLGLKDVSDKDVNEQYYSLLEYFNNLKFTNLKAANSIWVNKEINLNNDFKNTTNKYYSSQINSEDFTNPNTVNKINQWVDESTNGQIKKIIDNIGKDDDAVLINSLYFKGRWRDEFSPFNTKKEEFTLKNGEKINVDNMEARGHVDYLKGNNFQAISLPYNDGIEMDMFLPDQSVNIDNFISGITKENFDKCIGSFKSTDVVQQIPKFKMEYDTDLKDTLEALGIKQAFDINKANFTKFESNVPSDKSIYIGKIEHKACISVDEHGTEAAAITAEIMNGSSAPADNPIEFKVNRPFLFAIRDSKTGVILFMGKVENPSTNNN